MGDKVPEFSLASMRRIIERTGKKRISKDASLELSAVLESLGKEVAEEAIRNAKKEGLKTVKSKHIKKAAKELNI